MFSVHGITTAASNSGIIAYMNNAVRNDDHFFSMAYRFLGELQRRDIHRHNNAFSQTPIQQSAEFNVLDMALRTTNNNPYQALRLLALYGHDNEANDLSDEHATRVGGREVLDRARVLDAIKPFSNSTLYLNGALGVSYPQTWVDEGRAIAKTCQRYAPRMTRAQLALCNDNLRDYQGDYYHVITAAFLACRTTVSANAGDHVLPVGRVLPPRAMDRIYLHRVRKYKIARFKEAVKDAGDAAIRGSSDDRILPLVREGFERISEDRAPYIDAFETLSARGVSRQDYDIARAILHRMQFEVDFRVNQHKLGMALGQRLCASQRSFDSTESAPLSCSL